MVYGIARVSGDACVNDEAEIYDWAQVSGKACIGGRSYVQGYSKVTGTTLLSGDSRIHALRPKHYVEPKTWALFSTDPN